MLSAAVLLTLFVTVTNTNSVATVSQGIVRMQGLPFRATEGDIVSLSLNVVIVMV